MSVLAASIEDNPDNVTRFAVIGSGPSERTGRDKTSLLFELAHQPGALADVMAVFKRHRLNLTWIESFPKKGSQNEYLFFVEFEGHPNDLVVRKAIQVPPAQDGQYPNPRIVCPDAAHGRLELCLSSRVFFVCRRKRIARVAQVDCW